MQSIQSLSQFCFVLVLSVTLISCSNKMNDISGSYIGSYDRDDGKYYLNLFANRKLQLYHEQDINDPNDWYTGTWEITSQHITLNLSQDDGLKRYQMVFSRDEFKVVSVLRGGKGGEEVVHDDDTAGLVFKKQTRLQWHVRE